jgi:hypothetical protein
MSSLFRTYWKIGDNEIQASIYFNRDKINWATSQPKKIGYNVSVIPVKRTLHRGHTTTESGAFTGFNDCLLEVERQSSKRLQQAIEMLNTKKEEYLNYFKQRYGWGDTPAEVVKTE